MSSDFKNHRVDDPTKISPRQEKQVKKFVKEYFEKAVAKKREHEKKKAERTSKEGDSAASSTPAVIAGVKEKEKGESDGDQDMAMSDEDEDEKPKLAPATPVTPSDQLMQAERLKRKRANNEDADMKLEDDEATPSKRLKSESPPPPPPPPPPADGTPPDSSFFSKEGLDDISRHSYGENRSPGDTASMRMSPGNHDDPLRHRHPSNDRASAIRDDIDVSGDAHTPDERAEYDEPEEIYTRSGQRHLSDIEVHGAA